MPDFLSRDEVNATTTFRLHLASAGYTCTILGVPRAHSRGLGRREGNAMALGGAHDHL